MDSLPPAVLHQVEALLLEPAMKPVEEALGPLGSTLFGAMVRRCFDAAGT